MSGPSLSLKALTNQQVQHTRIEGTGLLTFALKLRETHENYAHIVLSIYEACSEVIETLAFHPEHIDIGRQNSVWIIIDLL